MSTEDRATDGGTYYDPAEVEAYVKEATATIKALQARLQDEVRRADQAEAAVAEYHPESAGLGRALLLAGEVADKTISDADMKASEILEAAKIEAAAIVDAGRHEGQEIVNKAKAKSDARYRQGEDRLLAAVNAFIQGVDVLRGELTKIREEDSATDVEPQTDLAESTSAPSPPDSPVMPMASRQAKVPFIPRPVVEDHLKVVPPSNSMKVAPFVPPSIPGGEPTAMHEADR